MKIVFFAALAAMLSCTVICYGQTTKTVNEVTITSTPDCSYLVNREGRINPGVKIEAKHKFSMKVNPNFHGTPSPFKHFIRTDYFNPKTPDLPEGPQPARTKYEYFDGLGNLLQTVDAGRTINKKDIISIVSRDQFNRESRKYLPYAAQGNGNYREDPINEQKLFYENTEKVAADREPWTESKFENSTRDRSRQSWSAGWQWHSDKSSISNFKLNTAEEVLRLGLGSNGLLTFSKSFWPGNSLSIDESVDEAGLAIKLYRDFRGQVILSRKTRAGEQLDTYFVYDVSGVQRFVVPPAGVKILESGGLPSDVQKFLDDYCFQFYYDNVGRVKKKVWPGRKHTEFIYDRWDRLVFTQDANQAIRGEWSYIKYDVHNRPIITGIIKGTRATLEKELGRTTNRFEERQSNSIGYTNQCFPSHDETNAYVINYYDCYSFLAYPGWDAEKIPFLPSAVSGIVAIADLLYAYDALKVYNPVVRGYKTGGKVKVLGSNKVRWLNEAVYYNREYKVAQAIRENISGGRDVLSGKFDVRSGNIDKSHLSHTAFGKSKTVVQDYFYDWADRLTKVTCQINSEPKVTLVQNKYNDLGQVVERNLHSVDDVSFLQSVDFRYNIQGWPTHINNSSLTNDGTVNDDADDLFGMEITYNEKVAIGSKFTGPANFDGNVAAIKWKTKTDSPETPTQEQIFAFKYDNFKRFNASYYAAGTTGAWTANQGMFNESVPYYDANGNIGGEKEPGLIRYGRVNNKATLIDKLTYTYEGNRLMTVEDSGSKLYGFLDKQTDDEIVEFGYDANGNMTFDMNKSIANIKYNHLNLPEEIELLREPQLLEEKVRFTYDALGNKLEKEVLVNGKSLWKTTFIGGIQFDNDQFTSMDTQEGRVVWNGTSHEYEYFLRDVYNNVRVVCGLLKDTKVYKATMETTLDAEERDVHGFLNITETRYQGNNFTLPTARVSAPNRSARCNGFGNASVPARPIGPAKKIQVSAGDAIYAEVFARYNTVATNPKLLTTALMGSYLTSAFSITTAENSVLWKQMNANVGLVGSGMQHHEGVPKAYLALQFYDENNKFVRSTAWSVSTSAFQQFEKLSVSFTADKKGTVYVYVANETAEALALDVFFDDLSVIHQATNLRPQVLQAFDYYPFGLPFNVYESERLRLVSSSPLKYEPVVRSRRMFQGQEYLKEFGLNYLEYKYRLHDPALGRFTALDPLAEDYMHNSPFAFSENFLLNSVELEGLEPEPLWKLMKHVSPIAVRFNYAFTSHDASVGFDVSVGIPKILPFSYRWNYGASYNFNDILENKAVAVTRSGRETSALFGTVSFQSTTYDTPNTPQTTGMITIGSPLVNISYENDWFFEDAMKIIDPFGFHPRFGGDGGDRFRTAALSANFGLMTTGFNIGTGDPGPAGKRNQPWSELYQREVYRLKRIDGIEYDPDRYRLGLVYFGYGPIRIGMNGPRQQHLIQNRFAHDYMLHNNPSPWFELLPGNNQLYLGFSNGTASNW